MRNKMHNNSNSDKQQNSSDPQGNKYNSSQTHLKFCLLRNINGKRACIKELDKFYLLILFSTITSCVDPPSSVTFCEIDFKTLFISEDVNVP